MLTFPEGLPANLLIFGAVLFAGLEHRTESEPAHASAVTTAATGHTGLDVLHHQLPRDSARTPALGETANFY